MSRNRRSRRPAVVAGALVTICLGMVTAADAGPQGPRTDPSSPPDAAQSRPVLDTDYSARPAPPDAETRLSAGDAVVAARGFLMPPDMTPGEPEVGLWLVTYWPVGMTLIEPGLATDGVGVASVFTDRLAWVVVFHDSPLDLHGPVHGPVHGTDQQRERMRAEAQCDMVFIVDANSGEGLNLSQLCGYGG